MEELKLLIEMVSSLPTMAIWVLAGFFAYKVICVGSVYGVIRLGITKLHDWLVTRKVEYHEIRPLLDGMCIKTETDLLIGQIARLKGKGTGISSDYIHRQSVEWLRDAIDEKNMRDNGSK